MCFFLFYINPELGATVSLQTLAHMHESLQHPPPSFNSYATSPSLVDTDSLDHQFGASAR